MLTKGIPHGGGGPGLGPICVPWYLIGVGKMVHNYDTYGLRSAWRVLRILLHKMQDDKMSQDEWWMLVIWRSFLMKGFFLPRFCA